LKRALLPGIPFAVGGPLKRALLLGKALNPGLSMKDRQLQMECRALTTLKRAFLKMSSLVIKR
jgi:hypothetical protein